MREGLYFGYQFCQSAKGLHAAFRLHIGGKSKELLLSGLEQIPRDAEQVLIAGMGGEEIIDILRDGFFRLVSFCSP